MQLTQHTDYGLRLLIVLARGDGAPLPLPAFASVQKLSYNHIVKVAQALAKAGFIEIHRGRKGGVSLARPAAKITIGEIVRALEPGLKLADCAGCELRRNCGASNLLADALAAFLQVLDETTLEEAANRPGPAFDPWARAVA
jgi:Rrf2 family nitric oxide-sensitive transcriptional repressor